MIAGKSLIFSYLSWGNKFLRLQLKVSALFPISEGKYAFSEGMKISNLFAEDSTVS
jgi:hypothetical protein